MKTFRSSGALLREYESVKSKLIIATLLLTAFVVSPSLAHAQEGEPVVVWSSMK